MTARLSTLTALALATIAGQAAATPVVVNINPLTPTSISRNGLIVGSIDNSSNFYRLTFGGPAIDVLTVQHDTYLDNIAARGFYFSSDDGNTFLGSIYNANSGPLYPNYFPQLTVAASYTPASGVWTPLPFTASASRCDFSPITQVQAMSYDARYVVINFWKGGCAASRGAIVDRNTNTVTELNEFSNQFNRSAIPLCTSSDGGIVGGLDYVGLITPTIFPAIWTRQGGQGTYTYTASIMKDSLGVQSKGGNVRDINRGTASVPTGRVLVGYSVNSTSTAANPVWAVYKWTSNGAGGWNATEIPLPSGSPSWMPGAVATSVFDVKCNDDGTVLLATLKYGSATAVALWDATNGWRDLRDYLFAQNASGLTQDSLFLRGMGINGDGTKLIGLNPANTSPSWYVDLTGTTNTCLAPTITVQPIDYPLVNHCTAIILNAGAVGPAEKLYQWKRNGVPVSDGTSPSGSVYTGSNTAQLIINYPHHDDAGGYSCTISSACNPALSATSRAATVAIDPVYTTAISNDTCQTAIGVGEGIFAYDQCRAWNDTDAETCVNFANVHITSDVWFLYTPSFTGQARIVTCEGSSISFNSVVSVYDSCGGTMIGCNNDASSAVIGCSPGSSNLSERSSVPNIPVVEGVPLLVRCATLGQAVDHPTQRGVRSLTILRQSMLSDNCADAVPLAPGATLFETYDATPDGDASTTCNADSPLAPDIWFTYTAPVNGRITLGTCGATFNTILSILDQCGGNLLACNDDVLATECGGTGANFIIQSVIRDFTVTAGTPYRIRLGGTKFLAGANAFVSYGHGRISLAFTPSSCNSADIASLGTGLGAGGVRNPDGQNTVDDLIAFLSAFFSGNTDAADFVRVGGATIPDGILTADDLIYFLSQFFAPCN